VPTGWTVLNGLGGDGRFLVKQLFRSTPGSRATGASSWSSGTALPDRIDPTTGTTEAGRFWDKAATLANLDQHARHVAHVQIARTEGADVSVSCEATDAARLRVAMTIIETLTKRID
jgi:hypothetical protein